MDVKLEGLEIGDLVQQAVTRALLNRLDTVLPKMVESMLSETGQYSKDTLVRKAIRSVVEDELQAQVQACIADKRTSIAMTVAKVAQETLQTEFIAECVVTALQQIKINVHPFKKVASEEED